MRLLVIEKLFLLDENADKLLPMKYLLRVGMEESNCKYFAYICILIEHTKIKLMVENHVYVVNFGGMN